MNGRWFDGRQLEASIADGNEKFKKSDDKKVALEDEDGGDGGSGDGTGAEGERLDRFGKWLEESSKGEK